MADHGDKEQLVVRIPCALLVPLAQLLADELDDERNNIRVNSLNPGATRTGMRLLAYPAEDPRKNLEPEALMPVYLYLMGRDSRGVNGQQFDAQPKK